MLVPGGVACHPRTGLMMGLDFVVTDLAPDSVVKIAQDHMNLASYQPDFGRR